MLHVHQTSLSGEAHAYLEWILPSSTVACCLVLILFRLSYTTQSLCMVPLRIEVPSKTKDPRTLYLRLRRRFLQRKTTRHKVREIMLPSETTVCIIQCKQTLAYYANPVHSPSIQGRFQRNYCTDIRAHFRAV
jgi:hypothetical protein